MSQKFAVNSVLALTAHATAAIAAHHFVGFAGATAAAGAKALGVARFDAAVGEDFTVDVLGAVDMPAGAAIAAGAELQVDAAGKPITKAAGVTVGVALTSAANPGDIVSVLLK